MQIFRSIEDLMENFQQNANLKTAKLMLLDINLPGMSGIQAIPFILEKSPHLEIIMLTTFDDSESIFSALQAGAMSYISKRSSLQEIKSGIDVVINGGSYMSPSIARKVVASFQNTKSDIFEDFTARQKQIVDGLVDGLSYQKIADNNFISVETVRDHIKKIYKKLQINSKAELIKMAYKQKSR